MSTIGSTTKEDNTDGGAGPTADNAPLIVPDDCLSHLFFSWATPLVIKGYSTPLVPDDVPWLHQGYDPQDLTESALRTYESLRQEEAAAEEAAAAETTEGQGAVPKEQKSTGHRLWRLAWRLQGADLYVAIGVSIFGGAMNCLVRPVVLKHIIDAVVDPNSYDNLSSALLVVGFAVVVFTESLSQVMIIHLMNTLPGMKFINWMTGLILHKCTRLRSSRDSNEASLVGNDVIRSFENMKWGCLIVMSLTGMVGAVAVLLYLIGWSALVGCGMIIAVLLVQFGMSYVTQAAEKLNLGKADARLSLLREVVTGIKSAKFLSYEEEYLRVIGEIRVQEVANIRSYQVSLGLMPFERRLPPF